MDKNDVDFSSNLIKILLSLKVVAGLFRKREGTSGTGQGCLEKVREVNTIKACCMHV
jgi:hypothetical protein